MSQSLHAPSLPGLLPHCHTGFSSLTLSLHLASILVPISHLSLLFSLPKLLVRPIFPRPVSTIPLSTFPVLSHLFSNSTLCSSHCSPSLQTQHYPGTISLPQSTAGKQPAWSCSSSTLHGRSQQQVLQNWSDPCRTPELQNSRAANEYLQTVLLELSFGKTGERYPKTESVVHCQMLSTSKTWKYVFLPTTSKPSSSTALSSDTQTTPAKYFQKHSIWKNSFFPHLLKYWILAWTQQLKTRALQRMCQETLIIRSATNSTYSSGNSACSVLYKC